LTVGSSSGRNGSNNEDFVLARFASDGGPGACGYVVDAYGGLHGFGVGTPARPPAAVGALYRGGVDFARGGAVSRAAGGRVVGGAGGLHPVGTAGVAAAPEPGPGPVLPSNLGRGVAMLPDGSGGYVLDGWGGMHAFAIGNHAKPPPVATPYW